VIRAISPLYFVATKLEAFKSRGLADIRGSHDLEDLVAVLAQREEVLEGIARASLDVSMALREELSRLCANDEFLDAIPGCFTGDDEGEELARSVTRKLLALNPTGHA
jgi:hypothetical protein